MSKNRRILLELLAPPFLAVVWLAILGAHESESFGIFVGGFFALLMFAYAFGIIPAVLYTVAMEFWFRSGLRARCGFLCTVGLSGLLGTAAGFLTAWLGIWLGFLTHPDEFWLARPGLLVGLLIGFYVGRKDTSAA